MKGQFFVIAAIIIAVSLVMVKGLLGVYPAAEASANENTRISDRLIENIAGSFEQMTSMSIAQSDSNASAGRYMSNFSEFIRNNEDSRVLWIIVFSNGTDQNYYVTCGNYLQSDIVLTINVTDSSPEGVAMTLPDRTMSSSVFTSSINGTINMTLSYELDGSYIEDTIQFTVSGKDSIAAYSDISLVTTSSRTRTKNVYYAVKQ